MRRSVHAYRVELTSPQMIDRHVVGNLEQPTRELELRAIAIDVIQDLDEGILRKVLGELPIADHSVDQREDGPLITANQLSKRRLPPCLREGDNVRVGQV